MKMLSCRRYLAIALLFALSMGFSGCGKKNDNANSEEVKKMEQRFDDFVKKYEERIKPAVRNQALAYFEASINSNDSMWKKFEKADMALNEIMSNKADFAELKAIKNSNLITDEARQRHLHVLYNDYLSKSIDTAKLNQLSRMQSAIEKKYSNFRAVVGNKKLTDNDVEDVLKTSKDSKVLEETWLAHKKIGPLVADDIRNLVKMRNQVAREIGFKNYHEMSLKLSDQDPEEISKLFDRLDDLTRDAFKSEKDKMDAILAAQYKINPSEMMPWHYQNRYFQEAPKIYDVDLDGYFKNIDIVKTAEGYYNGLNMPIEDMVAKSDLFEKPNKNQHAYCIDIDRDAHDIRVLCNIKPTARWMETTLHEYGHALYEKYLGNDLPFELKTPAHTFTTEAIAMMFGRFATNPVWMQDVIGLKPEEAVKISDACKKTLRLQQLVFSRWAQVMYRFEKSMYDNPDQDLNKLWWDLVEKYQMIKRPVGRTEPDWATKIHIATSPCYYHNYLLGELMASQLYYTIKDKVLGEKDVNKEVSFKNNPKVGDFLKEKVFSVGNRYFWNDMIEKATGEKLDPKYYAQQFVK